jgi:hypothetical protein
LAVRNDVTHLPLLDLLAARRSSGEAGREAGEIRAERWEGVANLAVGGGEGIFRDGVECGEVGEGGLGFEVEEGEEQVEPGEAAVRVVGPGDSGSGIEDALAQHPCFGEVALVIHDASEVVEGVERVGVFGSQRRGSNHAIKRAFI